MKISNEKFRQEIDSYHQTLIARFYNNGYSEQEKPTVSKIIEELSEILSMCGAEPVVDWEQGMLIDSICVHDKEHMIYGYDQFGNYWEATGVYTDGELVQVNGPEMQVKSLTTG